MKSLRRTIQHELRDLLVATLPDAKVSLGEPPSDGLERVTIFRAKIKREWGGMGRRTEHQKETVTVPIFIQVLRQDLDAADARLEEMINDFEDALEDNYQLGHAPNVQHARVLEGDFNLTRVDRMQVAEAAITVEAETRPPN